MKKLYLLFTCTVTFLFLNCKKDDGSIPVNDTPGDVIENPETDIFDFSPALGGWGTKVTIRGENFDPLPEGNEVQFNGMAAPVESASETTLVAIVPEDATTGKISLSALGYDYTSFQDFTVLLPPPIISDFEPKTGVEGDEITIAGDHFGDNSSAVDVLFHGTETPAEIKSISDTEIVILAPDAYSGNIQIRVADQYTISSDEFTYLPWRQRKDFEGVGRRFALAEAIGDKIYMGLGNSGVAKKDFWEYTPKTDIWIQLPDFIGTARHGMFHFILNEKLFVGGGRDYLSDTGPNDLFQFDSTTNTWTQLNDFPGNPNQVRQFATTFTCNGKAYVYSGYPAHANQELHHDLWEYDPKTDEWEEKSVFGQLGRASAVAFSIGNKGYVTTGIDIDDNRYRDVWEYDPQSDSWAEKEPLPQGMERYGSFGFSLNGKGYLGMGLDGNYNIFDDFWEFDPNANNGMGSWRSITPFPNNTNRQWPFATATENGKAYIGLGLEYVNYVFEFPLDIWEYTPRHDE